MKTVIKLFEQIKNESSKNGKISIIQSNKDNDLFKKCLSFLLDGNVVTGVSKAKINKNVKLKNDYFKCNLDNFEDVIKYLKEHNTGTDVDIMTIKLFINSQPQEYQQWYKDMITKSYKLGADYKTVNKALGFNLIKVHEIQQAYPISDKNMPKDGEVFALSQKLNGNNNAFVYGKNISRQGKEFTGLQHITDDINKLSFKDMFFNGELIRKNVDGLTDDKNFQIGTGIINSDNVDKSCIKFVIYEMLPVEEYELGESNLTYLQRREKYLNPLNEEIKNLELKNIEVVPLEYIGSDKLKINELLDEANSRGWEGLMLNKDTKWTNKRNNGILKVKSFKNADILCTGIVEGEGRLKGTLGLIKCDYKGYELGVGSGFTDEQRKFYWENPNEIINHIVQIKFKGETQNKQGGISVQFPTFVCQRFDKTEVSYE